MAVVTVATLLLMLSGPGQCLLCSGWVAFPVLNVPALNGICAAAEIISMFIYGFNFMLLQEVEFSQQLHSSGYLVE